MSSTPTTPRSGEWLDAWDPENEATWDKALAWKTLWITTFTLTMAFVAWFLPSAIVPKLNALGYTFSRELATGFPRAARSRRPGRPGRRRRRGCASRVCLRR